jgi:hypothetical protein
MVISGTFTINTTPNNTSWYLPAFTSCVFMQAQI